VLISKAAFSNPIRRQWYKFYTDKKENLIFPVYKEIQSGAAAKSL
jgi:hypothetical protein